VADPKYFINLGVIDALRAERPQTDVDVRAFELAKRLSNCVTIAPISNLPRTQIRFNDEIRQALVSPSEFDEWMATDRTKASLLAIVGRNAREDANETARAAVQSTDFEANWEELYDAQKGQVVEVAENGGLTCGRSLSAGFQAAPPCGGACDREPGHEGLCCCGGNDRGAQSGTRIQGTCPG
jgi:hypothetical protein